MSQQIDHLSQLLLGFIHNLVSYNRFVELMPRVLVPLCVYLQQRIDNRENALRLDSDSPVNQNRNPGSTPMPQEKYQTHNYQSYETE